MSNSLRTLLTKDKTFENNCDRIKVLVTIHKASSCGFDLLMKLLCDIFPHLGGDNIDVIDLINELRIKANDTLDSFLTKTVTLIRKIDNTKQVCPPNSIVHKFIKELRRDSNVEIKLSSIFLEYNNHIETHGPNVAFQKSPYEIYKFLKRCGVQSDKTLAPGVVRNNEITPTTCAATIHVGSHDEDIQVDDELVTDSTLVNPTTCAAIASSKNAPLYPPKRDTKNVRKPGSRSKKCKLCYQSDHNHMKCPNRGPEWSPVYIHQRVAKHSAIYPDEKPDPEYINQTPPLLAATTKSFAKKADVIIPEDNEEFLDALEEIIELNEDDKVSPEIKMADFNYDPDEYTVTSGGLVRT